MSDWRMPDPVPLRTARAWALTHDRGFARTIQDYPGLDLNGLAPLDGLSIAAELEKAMLAEGCFVEKRSRRRVTAATPKVLGRKTAPLVEHVMKLGYAGRFSTLARAYEAQRTDPGISDCDRKSVFDFLLNRLADAEREMLTARLAMEDAKGSMHPALVRAASIDPFSGEFVDPDGNARAGVVVDRSQLIERFPPARSETRHPEWQATLAEAGRRPRLPDREWLRLQEATTFAFYGVAFSSRVDPLSKLSAKDETLRELRYSSIYGSIDVQDSAALKRAELEFNRRLSEASLAGSVKFRSGGTDIPIHCFLNIREFSIADDIICPTLSDRHQVIDPELRDVMVERKSFLAWFAKTYPELCEPGIPGPEVTGDPLEQLQPASPAGRVAALQTDLNPTSKPPRPRSGGRRPQHHAPTFIPLLEKLFKEHGRLSDDDPEWNTNARVIQEVEALFAKRHPEAAVPKETWLKGLVRNYLAANPEQDGRKGR